MGKPMYPTWMVVAQGENQVPHVELASPLYVARGVQQELMLENVYHTVTVARVLSEFKRDEISGKYRLREARDTRRKT